MREIGYFLYCLTFYLFFISKAFLKKFEFFFKINIFFVFLDYFDALISQIIFKK